MNNKEKLDRISSVTASSSVVSTGSIVITSESGKMNVSGSGYNSATIQHSVLSRKIAEATHNKLLQGTPGWLRFDDLDINTDQGTLISTLIKQLQTMESESLYGITSVIQNTPNVEVYDIDSFESQFVIDFMNGTSAIYGVLARAGISNLRLRGDMIEALNITVNEYIQGVEDWEAPFNIFIADNLSSDYAANILKFNTIIQTEDVRDSKGKLRSFVTPSTLEGLMMKCILSNIEMRYNNIGNVVKGARIIPVSNASDYSSFAASVIRNIDKDISLIDIKNFFPSVTEDCVRTVMSHFFSDSMDEVEAFVRLMFNFKYTDVNGNIAINNSLPLSMGPSAVVASLITLYINDMYTSTTGKHIDVFSSFMDDMVVNTSDIEIISSILSSIGLELNTAKTKSDKLEILSHVCERTKASNTDISWVMSRSHRRPNDDTNKSNFDIRQNLTCDFFDALVDHLVNDRYSEFVTHLRKNYSFDLSFSLDTSIIAASIAALAKRGMIKDDSDLLPIIIGTAADGINVTRHTRNHTPRYVFDKTVTSDVILHPIYPVKIDSKSEVSFVAYLTECPGAIKALNENIKQMFNMDLSKEGLFKYLCQSNNGSIIHDALVFECIGKDVLSILNGDK